MIVRKSNDLNRHPARSADWGTLWILLWKTRDNGDPTRPCDIRVTTTFRGACGGPEK
jgi:hypothetical protein